MTLSNHYAGRGPTKIVQRMGTVLGVVALPKYPMKWTSNDCHLPTESHSGKMVMQRVVRYPRA
jgi:hypothetical protein